METPELHRKSSMDNSNARPLRPRGSSVVRPQSVSSNANKQQRIQKVSGERQKQRRRARPRSQPSMYVSSKRLPPRKQNVRGRSKS